MRELVHRHVPSDPAVRTAYAVLAALSGVPLVAEGTLTLLAGALPRGAPIWGLGFLPESHYVGNVFAFVLFVVGVVLCLASYHLARGVAEQAAAAPPEAAPTKRVRASSDGDAVAELQSRYARGELDDEEFDRRVQRLLEVDELRDETGGTANTANEGRPSARKKESSREP